MEPLTIKDYEEVLADHRRLVRELDGILSGGIEHAAKQASLCDLIPVVKQIVEERNHYREVVLNPIPARRFPMQDGPSIDMVAARAIYQVYSCMHSGQSLAEIAQRGGFAWMEVGHLLEKHAEYKQRGNCTCPKT